jgi:DNA-damage-inducible protein J
MEEFVMANTTMVNFRLDADVKKGMEKACKEMGLSVTTAFTMFATKVSREQKIPFTVEVDPFYSEENMARLQRSVAALKAGKGFERELIEVND